MLLKQREQTTPRSLQDMVFGEVATEVFNLFFYFIFYFKYIFFCGGGFRVSEFPSYQVAKLPSFRVSEQIILSKHYNFQIMNCW